MALEWGGELVLPITTPGGAYIADSRLHFEKQEFKKQGISYSRLLIEGIAAVGVRGQGKVTVARLRNVGVCFKRMASFYPIFLILLVLGGT